MSNFIIIEVGSINTKTYLYENKLKKLMELDINFKRNFDLNKRIMESDLEKLYDHIATLAKYNYPIYVFGIGVFNNLDNLEKGKLLKDFKDNTGIDFNIISPDMEKELIVDGVIADTDYDKKLAIAISNNETTDIFIIENRKIIEIVKNNYGSTDICDRFNDLNDDVVTTTYMDMLNDTLDMTKIPNNKTDILILAGDNYLDFYNNFKYPLSSNKFYKNYRQPWVIDYESMIAVDEEFFYHKSLLEMENEKFSNHYIEGGNIRGNHICMSAIAKAVNAKYIVPTNITMIYGIIEKVRSN